MLFVKQNDLRPEPTAVLKHGATIVPLTLASSVKFKMRRRAEKTLKVDGVATITDAAAGAVKYSWVSGDTDTPGTWVAEWEVIWADGTPETFPTIDYDIVVIRPDLDGSS